MISNEPTGSNIQALKKKHQVNICDTYNCSLDVESCLENHSMSAMCDLLKSRSYQNISWRASTSLSRCINFKVLAVVLKPQMAWAEGQPALPVPGSELHLVQTDPCSEWLVLIGTFWSKITVIGLIVISCIHHWCHRGWHLSCLNLMQEFPIIKAKNVGCNTVQLFLSAPKYVAKCSRFYYQIK